jgi:hypothetical protein
MMTGDELDRFTQRTLRELREMSSAQRTDFVERVLHADPALTAVLPEILATCARARYVRHLGRPLLRDSVM